MLSLTLKRHAREFLSALTNHKYEQADNGLYLPGSKLFISGKYTHTVNGKDEQVDRNLIPAAGVLHFLNVTLFTTAKTAAWYLAPYSGNATPLSSWTAANYAANATENVSETEGYSGTLRKLYVPATAVDGSITNAASRANFDIVTAGTVSFYGAGLLSTSTRGDTSGILISATRFGSTRVLSNGDVWGLGYEVDAIST